jgi:hypothetical protein
MRRAFDALWMLLKLLLWGQQQAQTQADKKEVADAVEAHADHISDTMRNADPDSVQPDDPRLIRPR